MEPETNETSYLSYTVVNLEAVERQIQELEKELKRLRELKAYCSKEYKEE